ncbi:MAG: YitT family protein, partial [Synergistaceae bacterium]
VACYISGQTMDDVLSSFDKRRLVFIITPIGNQGPILEYIAQTLNKGATLFDSRGGFTLEERATMMCLLTPRQTMELKRYLAMHFPSTFLVVSEASEVLGNGFKRWKNI